MLSPDWGLAQCNAQCTYMCTCCACISMSMQACKPDGVAVLPHHLARSFMAGVRIQVGLSLIVDVCI